MSSFESNKRHLRELLIYFLNLKKSTVESHRLLVEEYDETASSESCRECFQKFKNGEFDIEDNKLQKYSSVPEIRLKMFNRI